MSKSNISIMEKFQKKVVNWIFGTGSYIRQIIFLNILPLPKYIVAKLVITFTALKRIIEQHRATTNRIFNHDRMNCSNCQILRKKQLRKKFVFRTSRLANNVNHLIDCNSSIGHKKRFIQLLWKFLETKVNESNTCTWQLACVCQNCREKRRIFLTKCMG